MRRRTPPEPDPLELELLGDIHYCFGCDEWWPADAEFFSIDRATGAVRRDRCLACQAEARQKHGLKACIVPGCPNPRAHWRFARCTEHLQEQAANRKRKKVETCSTELRKTS